MTARPHGAPGERRAFDRATALERLAAEHFDVLVVGGGITGAGVALDAASRGLKTALVDKGDFASGTSSRSSKLVHGGLRYLRRRDLGLVHESLVERQRLLRNAPHLVSPLPFLIPLLGREGLGSAAAVRSYSVALGLYDLAGAWRIGRRHRRVSAAQAAAHVPALRPERLVAGLVYYDAQADDARLTLAVTRSAVLDHGAVAANYTAVVELLSDPSGRVAGARVSPVVRPGAPGAFGEAAQGPDFDVSASVVVNATGVWADDVVTMAAAATGAPVAAPALRPAKGVHVCVRAAALPCDVAAVLPAPGSGRSVFVVPWPAAGRTYVGTTDTAYEGSLDDPGAEPDDVAYLLEAVNAATTASLTPGDVTGVWAGLRPLLAPGDGEVVPSDRTADLSRRHAVSASDGVVTVTGGKLTTYRRMAQDAVDAAVAQLPGRSGPGSGRRRAPRRSRTARLRLHGAPPARRRELADAVSAPAGRDDYLAQRYGTEAAAVLALARGRPELLDPLVPGLPYLAVEALWAARQEMAQSVDDVLSRRTRAAVQDAPAAVAAADTVAGILAPELGWTPEQAAAQAEQFRASVRAELERAGVPAPVGESP